MQSCKVTALIQTAHNTSTNALCKEGRQKSNQRCFHGCVASLTSDL